MAARFGANLGSGSTRRRLSALSRGGGMEVKATCGSVPTSAVCKRRGVRRPHIGDTRIGCLQGYDWKSHHRGTNNLVDLLWDFVAGRPRVAAVFYASNLTQKDWGEIVQPKVDGGRTTSVSIMARSGIRKMYEGWLCVLADRRLSRVPERSQRWRLDCLAPCANAPRRARSSLPEARSLLRKLQRAQQGARLGGRASGFEQAAVAFDLG